MHNYDYLEPELLRKAFLFSGEICWKLKDIQHGIKELDRHGKKIEAISIYFKVGEEVYNPLWGDCLMLEDVNQEYLELFSGIDIEKKIDHELIYQLIGKFALFIPEDYDWTKDILEFRIHVPKELAEYKLEEMYFALSIHP